MLGRIPLSLTAQKTGSDVARTGVHVPGRFLHAPQWPRLRPLHPDLRRRKSPRMTCTRWASRLARKLISSFFVRPARHPRHLPARTGMITAVRNVSGIPDSKSSRARNTGREQPVQQSVEQCHGKTSGWLRPAALTPAATPGLATEVRLKPNHSALIGARETASGEQGEIKQIGPAVGETLQPLAHCWAKPDGLLQAASSSADQ